MGDELDKRLSAIGNRAREAMARGATLDDVLNGFRIAEGLRSIESIIALRAIALIDSTCAKDIVTNSSEGQSYAHVTLSILDTLADTPRTGGVDFFTRGQRDTAIIHGEPYVLYTRDPSSSSRVRTYTSKLPLAQAPHLDTLTGISGDTVTFERVCNDVRRSAAAWPTEFRVVRDEPDELLLHVTRARS